MNNKKDCLFEYMAGEFLKVIIDKDVEKSCIISSGYLVDEDDIYIYLGPKPDVITQAIKKDYLVHIESSMEELVEIEGLPEEKNWN